METEIRAGVIRAYLAGVGEYSIARVRPLPFCRSDRAIMREALIRGLSVRPEHIAGPGAETGVVTTEEFTGSLRAFFQEAGEEDTLIFWFSGHGVNREGRHCLMLSDGMIETQSVIDLFDESPVRHKVLFLDCCMSGNYEMSEPAMQAGNNTAEKEGADWPLKLPEGGCIVFASSGAEELSGAWPGGQLSLFTTFLAEALTNPFLIRDGAKTMERIREYVFLRAAAWNEQNPGRAQNPVYRSSAAGTIRFPVPGIVPYVTKRYYADHEDYIICEVSPLHANTKRYVVKLILKHPAGKTEAARIAGEAAEEVKTAEIYRNAREEARFRGKTADIIYGYLGYDEDDILNANYAYTFTWAGAPEDRGKWYRPQQDAEILHEVQIKTNPSYRMLRKFSIDNTGEAAALYREEKSLILQMIGAAERVIYAFREYENRTIPEEVLAGEIRPQLEDIHRLYMKSTYLPIAPKELREWSDAGALLTADIHDMTLIYGGDGMEKRTPENRRLMMEDVIRRYEKDLETFRTLEQKDEQKWKVRLSVPLNRGEPRGSRPCGASREEVTACWISDAEKP